MSVINNGLLLASAAEAAVGYQISRSLRFNSSDSAYCTRQYTSAPTTRTKGTISFWVKRAALGSNQWIFDCYDGSSSASSNLRFRSDNAFEFQYGGSAAYSLITTQVFRDPSAWYHFVFILDSTLGTSSDRVKMYVNGVRVTTFLTANYPPQNANHLFTINTALNRIGCRQDAGAGTFLSAYLADFTWLDGIAVADAGSFGEFDATTGAWNPKAYTGSYGTNGFRLPFSDNSGTTSTTLGKDSAGNNNFTPNNFSVASGSGNDSLVDSPSSFGTDTGVGGEIRGNYATLNPLHGTGTLSNGNLDFTSAANPHKRAGTMGVFSGKWYYEAVMTAQVGSYQGVGVGNQNYIAAAGGIGGSADSWGILSESGINGYSYHNNSAGPDYGTINVNDVMMVAYDVDAGKIWFGVNGTWFNSGAPASGTGAIYTNLSGTLFPAISSGSGGTLICNFGQRSFSYQAPAGFKSLCTANLPTPTIAKGSDYMDVKLYTGNGSTQTISGLNFSPDLVWLRNRSQASNWVQFDTVRGALIRLCSNLTVSEASLANSLTSFDSTGFTYGSEGSGNNNGDAFAAFCWDAGTSTVTNTQGSITSTVRANASAGFSIVTWTGNGTAGATVGHSLGAAPSFIVLKRRSGVNNSWGIYHSALGATKVLQFDTNSVFTDTTSWNDTAPTSTVFSLGTSLNTNTGTYVAYCFAPVAGYSSMSSWVGNGSSDGVFVYLGFRPRFLIWKNSSGVANWYIYDSARSTYNVTNLNLEPNTSDAENTLTSMNVDFVSNGFKIRGSDGDINGNGSTYIYAAFAESPFAYARAR